MFQLVAITPIGMRSLSVLVGLCSLACFAEEPYEVFVDRGETYLRAGTAMGLELGSMVIVWGDLIPTTKERRRAGTGTVMEVWASLARINLDDAARADKAAKKYASFAAKQPPGAPLFPPVAAVDALPPPPAPPAAAPSGILRGRATYKGAGPWMVLALFNDEAFDWTKCTVSLPGNLFYSLSHLKAGDRESIALSNFVQQGPDREVRKDSVTVRCAQGASKFMFPRD